MELILNFLSMGSTERKRQPLSTTLPQETGVLCMVPRCAADIWEKDRSRAKRDA